MPIFNPVSTYRLQFQKAFNFDDFEQVIPYLQKLGVNTIYASPVFEATPGSTHGYDSTDPNQINPEIGTLKQLKAITKKLKARDIDWLQDIVPNHMAFHPQNLWLTDVLEKGSLSSYKDFFDLSLTGELYHGRIMVPFLGADLQDVIKNGELKIAYEDQKLVFKYYDNSWPLNLRSYHTVLGIIDEPDDSIRQLIEMLPLIGDYEKPKSFALAMEEFIMQLASLIKNPESKIDINALLKKVNNNKKLLQKIEDQQEYHLCHWQDTDQRINFRRFFTVNGLICLNIQHDEVFRHFHKLIGSLVKNSVFQGLRIDHIDGLYNPPLYLEKLRKLVGKETYIIVEKILERGEDLHREWPVEGNTGYDFLGIVNNLFTRKSSERIFTRFYKLVDSDNPVNKQILKKKTHILYESMGGELENLYRLFTELALIDKETLNTVSPDDLKKAIGEFLINCPVYRYYGNSFPLDPDEASAIKNIIRAVRNSNKNLHSAIDLLETVILKNPAKNNKEYNGRALQFYQRCMQFTGPLMAKGVEDTLMYTYNRFIGHNEVGDSPEAFGLSNGEFHKRMKERQESWPLSINTTSTHDTKRGEDVRARLNILTDLGDEWLQTVKEWQILNQGLKSNGFPYLNDEYFIYQTLIGSYPMPDQDEDDFDIRLQQYLEKALREAKQHSNWSSPNEEYEKAAIAFAVGLLDKQRPFWESFKTFHNKVADFGIINSLSQVLLKFTCPGVPDVYQGCELWDLSMVDPDNRRPVDYFLRKQFLEELEAGNNDAEKLLRGLWENRYNAKIKIWLTQKLLLERKENPFLFEKGGYIPLQTKGRFKDIILAFARRYQDVWYVMVIPLHIAKLSSSQKQGNILKIDWKNTRIVLPPEAPQKCLSLFLNDEVKQKKGEIAIKDIFTSIPLAILKLEKPENSRGAGILMHVTSLPSEFGIGDFGSEAKAFARFLSRSCQKYWQLLPLSPTEHISGHSPYSSYSSMAGNPLLISPELLADSGLLSLSDLNKCRLPVKDKADYRGAIKVKNQLFKQAWTNFKNGAGEAPNEEFISFKEKEAYWLDDFALYVIIKQHHVSKPWYLWPEEYRLRNPEILAKFTSEHTDELNKVKWLQYIFTKQWKALKEYCNNLGINILGDLPFYVSYDSVDVWAQPSNFSLDADGNMQGVAGVPPDYFNEDGQLWGMPVFCWDTLKENNYDWWIRRIKKNMEYYDLLRLDHFRAFAAYWEVPAKSETARNGKWVTGPGADFFKALQKELGELPFLAEDLGDIDDTVHLLREEFKLPGMKVLQFAFGDEMPSSDYIPHNYTPDYFVYTGTHDNNTTKGWYRKDVQKSLRKQIGEYTGMAVNEKNIHHILSRIAYASIAKTAILPMQDVLGLDETGRINTPASVENNWLWRILPGQLNARHESQLRDWVKLYHRD